MMKLLVCISLALTCVAAEYECIPGAYFTQGCNTCSCSSEGKILACTNKACPPKGNSNIIRIDSTQDHQRQECTPGSTYNDYCNVCSCLADGSAFVCTMMYCDKNVWNKDGSLKVPALTQKSQSENKKVCESDATFNDYCNVCKCSTDGTYYACTMMACNENVWNKDGTIKHTAVTQLTRNENVKIQECKAGTTFNDYCNICTCANDGTYHACTMMLCDKNIWTKDGIIKETALTHKSLNKNKQVCTPGAQFNDYCNLCKCSDDGTAVMCTAMFCNENIWNKDGSRKDVALLQKLGNENQRVCTPGVKFNDYCNVCTCLDDGSNYYCTMILCDENVWNKDGSRKDTSALSEQVQNENKQVCTPGVKFNDYCNVCTCLDDGSNYYCTMILCDENVWNKDGSRKDTFALSEEVQNEKKQVCTPGVKFNDYCNVCTCLDDGSNYFCTMILCDENVWNKDGSRKDIAPTSQHEKKQVCTPGTTFNNYCNLCICLDDVSNFFCTTMFCDEKVWNKDGSRRDSSLALTSQKESKQVCTPGAKFNDYCNVCTCLADGSNYFCSMMYCDKNIWNKDGSFKDSSSLVQKSQNEKEPVCTPGTTFNNYCNVCTCLADGSNFFCTRMFCDENVWNKDGSRKDKSLAHTSQNGKLCEPGKSFSPDDCNTCVCNEDGTNAACTQKLCLGNFKSLYKVTDEETWGPLYEDGDACTPGRAFYSECNRCVCTESGRSAFCTLMSCRGST